MAQTESAAVSGRVTDQSGAVVPGAEIELRDVDTNGVQVVKTNSEGFYSIPSIRPGNYVMSVRKQGFRTVSVTGITLDVQDNLSRNFTMLVGSSSESVTVTAGANNINTTDASVSTVVDHTFVENLPLNGRSFQDLIALVPGVLQVGSAYSGTGSSGEFSVNGQRTEANYFTVDGVSANTGTTPGSFGNGAGFAGATGSETAIGTTQAMVSIDALQEFRATTSTYSAEYGRTPGGQFALTTRSGTNDWHGSLYEYFRNDALDATNWFVDQLGLPKVEERQNDFGGTVGGPVRIPHVYDGKDKTFFFFSYEGARLRTPQGVQTTLVPDTALRANAPAALQPLLNAFPIPQVEDGLGDGLGLYSAAYSLPSSSDSESLRVDQSVGSKTRLFGRFANTPSVATDYSGSIQFDSIINTRLLTLGATTSVTPTQTNEFRFNITQANSNARNFSTSLGGAVPFDTSTLPGPNGGSFPQDGGTIGVCFCFGDYSFAHFNGSLKNSQRQYNFTDSYSLALKSHVLRFGVDWRRLSTVTSPITLFESVVFDSEASILANAADSATVNNDAFTASEPIYTNFSAFVQDEWKATSRLSLALGVRWDVAPPPSNGRGTDPYTVDQIANLATTKLAPAGTPLWHTDWHAFAPRIGGAYQLRRVPGRETVVRAGFGTFFDLGNANASSGLGEIGFSSRVSYSNVSFPLTSSQVTLPAPSVLAPYSTYIQAFDPHLVLPRTYEWNLALEQAFGSSNLLTVSYVGSAGRKLLSQFVYSPEDLGNPNFNSSACAACLYITKNGTSSNYHSLQTQFQRKLSRGLQALASYTWSHSLDDASSNFLLQERIWGSSDFDVRHNLQMGITYNIPSPSGNRLVSALLSGWGLDTRISYHTALPVDIIGTQSQDPATHTFLNFHPDVVPGQPLYLYGSEYPGGRIINANAFVAAPDNTEGNSGRNSARGFGASQVNLALRRQFPIHDRLKLQFRAEAFNVFNHPNFGGVVNYLGSGPCTPLSPGQSYYCFGVATDTLNNTLGGLNSLFQSGGPRSLQIALRLAF